jgi:two-component system, sensor histidine kinase and response regulator
LAVTLPLRRASAADLPSLSGDGLSRLLGYADAVAEPEWGSAPGVVALDVLLVEDNPVNQRLAQEILLRRGHRVVLAENGREALDRLAERGFDIVLMDVQMPQMNGLDATRAIRAAETGTGRHIPIVAMTAHAMAGDRERCLAAGMDEYLTKPIRVEALITHVERMGDRGQGPKASRGPGARDQRPDVSGQTAGASGQESRVTQHESSVGARRPAFEHAEALARVDQDAALLAEIAGLFLADKDAMLAEIRAALDAGDLTAVSRAAHRLKGSVSTFGAKAAGDAALALEDLDRTRTLDGAQQKFEALTAEIRRLSAALSALIAEQKRTA